MDSLYSHGPMRNLRDVEDLERVPIVLKNAPFFRPFELLTSLLPLPAYTSYDPTPFIGIFFPIFFGMILGDAGYGLVLVALAAWLRRLGSMGGRPKPPSMSRRTDAISGLRARMAFSGVGKTGTPLSSSHWRVS